MSDRICELRERHREAEKAYSREYEELLINILKEHRCYDVDVIRVKDNVRGRFKVEKSTYSPDYDVKFCPYTKKGELSLKSSGYMYSWEEGLLSSILDNEYAIVM